MCLPVLKQIEKVQETKQLDILERYMTQSHGSDSFERVDSDSATKIKEGAIQRFNAEGSKRFVLLLKTGVHISFKNVQFLLLYDSDWNPSNDMRALHKIHNEGEASSKPLPVLRLYTHLTVEESTLILFRDKQLPPTRSNVSARICQKLLTWGASKIFDRYDSTNCPTGSSYRPKGAKFCPKAKLKQVVYNPEVVQKLLEALRCEEVGNKLEGDELLEAILVPRDEPASLFAESEHPINMVIGDSAEAFWAESLKSRHDDWQSKEVFTSFVHPVSRSFSLSVVSLVAVLKHNTVAELASKELFTLVRSRLDVFSCMYIIMLPVAIFVFYSSDYSFVCIASLSTIMHIHM